MTADANTPSATAPAGRGDALILRVAPGDPSYVFVEGIAKPINCGSGYMAERIVHCVNTHSHLLAQNAELLVLVKRYASECGECHGTGSVATKDDFGVSDTACGYCAHIRSVIDRCSP